MRKLLLLILFVALTISDLALASDDLYRWIDPLTGQTILNSSPPNNYPIKEQRVTGNLPSGKGHQIDVIIDIDSPNLDPKVKTLIEKRKIQQAEEKRISEDKNREREAREVERQRIAEEKAKEQARTVHAEDMIEVCKVSKKLAENVMYGRQHGRSMEEMINIRNQLNNSQVRKLMGRMLVVAYDYPLRSNGVEKLLAVVDFGDTNYKECLKEMMDEEIQGNTVASPNKTITCIPSGVSSVNCPSSIKSNKVDDKIIECCDSIISITNEIVIAKNKGVFKRDLYELFPENNIRNKVISKLIDQVYSGSIYDGTRIIKIPRLDKEKINSINNECLKNLCFDLKDSWNLSNVIPIIRKSPEK